MGFLRIYSYLIRYDVDFTLAQEIGLIPKGEILDGGEGITSETFIRFISYFSNCEDTLISPRYTYGELRLTRLNFYSCIFLGKLTYHHIEAQWGPFLNSVLTPFIAAAVIVSVILNAMQVELAIQDIDNIKPYWAAFAIMSKWVSVLVLALALLVVTFILILVLFFFFHDIWFAQSIIRQKRNLKSIVWTTQKSGVI